MKTEEFHKTHKAHLDMTCGLCANDPEAPCDRDAAYCNLCKVKHGCERAEEHLRLVREKGKP